MAKAKKISIRPASSSKGISFRLMDAVLILLVGGFGSLSLYMYQDIRKDVNVLLHNQEVFKTQVAPKLGEEIDSVRTSIRDIYARIAVKKTRPAPAAPVKGKRSAQNEGGAEQTDAAELKTADTLKMITDSYWSVNENTRLWESRSPASVDGQDHSKNLQWVVSQIGLCFSWMLVMGAIVMLILKLVDPASRSQDKEHDQF